MAQHTVEFLVRLGIKRIDFVLCHLSHQVEQFLGDGTKWGCQFHFHLAPGPERLYHSIRFLDRTLSGDPVILGTADQIPGSDLEAHLSYPGECELAAFVAGGARSEAPAWTGWSLLPSDLLRTLSRNQTSEDFERELLAVARQTGRIIPIREPLGSRCAKELLESNVAVLSQRHAGAELQRGRNTRIHPTAKIIPPVYIGENADIGPRSVVGPNVVIGRDSVVSRDCTLDHSLVFPETYVGPKLSLSHAMADHGRLINARLGAVVEDVDSFLLRRLSGANSASQGRLRGRSAALALLLLFAPLLLLVACWCLVRRNSGFLKTRRFVRLPGVENPALWRTGKLTVMGLYDDASSSLAHHFLYVFLPGLVQVITGAIDLTGVALRTREEMLDVPVEWRTLLLQSSCGLINESILRRGLGVDSMELWAAESLYTVRRSYQADVQLLRVYLLSVVQELTGNRTRSQLRELSQAE